MRTLLGTLALGATLGCNATPEPSTPSAVTASAPVLPPPDAVPVAGGDEPLPAGRTIDPNAMPACGPFTLGKGRRAPVLGGRLEMATVDQAKNEPRPWNVMSAPVPDEEETRLIAEANGKKWVVLVSETWQTDPGPRPLEVKIAGREPFQVGPRVAEIGRFAGAIWDRDRTRGLSVDRIVPKDPALTLLVASPQAWVVEERPGGNATLALGVVAILPDSTLVSIAFYSNEPDEKNLAGCKGLAESLAASLTVGPRRLDLSARTVKLAPTRWAIDLPESYVMTHQPGPDFEKFTVRKLRPLGLYPGQIQIVDDPHPERVEGAQTVPGKLLGKPTQWKGEFDDKGGQLFAMSPKQANGAYLVVGILATRDGAFLDELRQVAETIR